MHRYWNCVRNSSAFGSSVAVVSFRPIEGAGGDLPARLGEDLLAVRINADSAQNFLMSEALTESPANAPGAAAAFVSRLAQSPDSRLREAAAMSSELAAEDARRLVRDPSSAVREALASYGPVGRLEPQDRLELAGGDSELQEKIIRESLNAAEEALKEAQSKGAAEALKDLEAVRAAEEVFEGLLGTTDDPSVKGAAREARASLEAKLAGETENGPAWPRFRGRRDSQQFDAAEGGYGFAVVFLSPEDSGRGKPCIDWTAPVLRLGPQGAADALDALCTGSKDAGAMALRCAQSRFAAMRLAAARFEGLPASAVDIFKRERTASVRRAALGNSEFVEALSEADLLELIGEDPAMAVEADTACSSRMGRILKEAFENAEDPALADLAAQIML